MCPVHVNVHPAFVPQDEHLPQANLLDNVTIDDGAIVEVVKVRFQVRFDVVVIAHTNLERAFALKPGARLKKRPFRCTQKQVTRQATLGTHARAHTHFQPEPPHKNTRVQKNLVFWIQPC